MTDPSIIRFRERERQQRERARLVEEERRRKTRPAPQNHDDRLAKLELELAQFGAQVTQARRVQMQQALMENRAQIIADIERHLMNPPTPPEPTIIYVEADQGTGRLGHSDFDPRLMAQPLRWW
jgi:hypothetical protein